MVKVEHITYTYNPARGYVLDDVSFNITPGQCVAILGSNGAGKSTLLKCMDRIYPVKEGRVEINGQNVFEMNNRRIAQNIAYVSQNAQVADINVFEAVLLGRKPYIKWDTTEEDRRIVKNIIRQMGLSEYILRNISELSGGEVQKVMMARALAQQPKLLLLDEPTSNLDPKNQHEVLQLIRNIARSQNICVAIIIHDLNLALRYCDQFLFLKDSKVYSYSDKERITPDMIEAVYDMQVEIIYHEDIPMVVPFPEKVTEQRNRLECL